MSHSNLTSEERNIPKEELLWINNLISGRGKQNLRSMLISKQKKSQSSTKLGVCYLLRMVFQRFGEGHGNGYYGNYENFETFKDVIMNRFSDSETMAVSKLNSIADKGMNTEMLGQSALALRHFVSVANKAFPFPSKASSSGV